MKLKQFMESLNKFIKENPEALELDVICKENINEMRSYYNVCTPPKFAHKTDGSCYDKREILEEIEKDKECGEGEGYDYKINAVCIN